MKDSQIFVKIMLQTLYRYQCYYKDTRKKMVSEGDSHHWVSLPQKGKQNTSLVGKSFFPLSLTDYMKVQFLLHSNTVEAQNGYLETKNF